MAANDTVCSAYATLKDGEVHHQRIDFHIWPPTEGFLEALPKRVAFLQVLPKPEPHDNAAH